MPKKPRTAKPSLNIMIVDDHPIFRMGLSHLINQQDDLTVCCEAESTKDALAKLKKHHPQLIIVDLKLKDSDGIDLIREINRIDPLLPCLVVSMYEESVYAERALRAGAKGYVMKQEVDETIIRAIRRVLEGGYFLTSAFRERMVSDLAERDSAEDRLAQLSKREFEVFRMIGNGMRTPDIAQHLNVSAKTVETYRARVKTKLGLENASELAKFAVHWCTTADPI